MDDERKHDIKEFNNLKNQINSLWKEIEIDDKSDLKLLMGENKDNFIDALNSATNFVDNISPYFDELEKEDLLDEKCDFDNLNDKHTKKVIKVKKKELDETAKEINELIKNPILSNLFLEVTLRCNAKCEHCGSSCGYSIPKDELSAKELKNVIHDVYEKYGNRVFLTVTGGEPLMRQDLFDIMEYAHNLGFHWGMTTNGMLINKRIVDLYRKTNMESISISLDGLKETHESFRKVPGSFDKIMKAIDLLKELECLNHLQITTVANKKNLHELEDIYTLLLGKGIKEWRVMCVDPIGRAYENDGILLDKEGLK